MSMLCSPLGLFISDTSDWAATATNIETNSNVKTLRRDRIYYHICVYSPIIKALQLRVFLRKSVELSESASKLQARWIAQSVWWKHLIYNLRRKKESFCIRTTWKSVASALKIHKPRITLTTKSMVSCFIIILWKSIQQQSHRCTTGQDDLNAAFVNHESLLVCPLT